MTRSASASWDLASSVGATATMVATARALATRQPDPIINDPYAADLVRAVGIDFFTQLVDGDARLAGDAGAGIDVLTDMMAVRTRFFDDFFTDAWGAGVRQAVILASGLDSRPYRLPWAAGTVIYEIDQPQVITAKNATMARLGARPTAELRTVAVDLREDWPAALCEAGFDASAPCAWSAEGLLMYLPPDAQDRLFDNITELSAAGSRIATEFHGGDFGATLAERAKDITDAWQGDGFDIDVAELFCAGERNHVVDYLSGRGWQVRTRNRLDVFADYGRSWPTGPDNIPLQDSVAVTAVKVEG